MNFPIPAIFCGVIVLAGLLLPAAGAVDPLWTERATTRGELSGVVISADGSTIVAGGDQLIALTPDGQKLWTGWSGARLAISSNGTYILTSRDQTVRLISGSGTMLWDVSLGDNVADMDMTPDASLIAAGGGSRVDQKTGRRAGACPTGRTADPGFSETRKSLPGQQQIPCRPRRRGHPGP